MWSPFSKFQRGDMPLTSGDAVSDSRACLVFSTFQFSALFLVLPYCDAHLARRISCSVQYLRVSGSERALRGCQSLGSVASSG